MLGRLIIDIDFVSKKVNQRLGDLHRIKHLLPIYARNVFVSAMVSLFFFITVILSEVIGIIKC